MTWRPVWSSCRRCGARSDILIDYAVGDTAARDLGHWCVACAFHRSLPSVNHGASFRNGKRATARNVAASYLRRNGVSPRRAA